MTTDLHDTDHQTFTEIGNNLNWTWSTTSFQEEATPIEGKYTYLGIVNTCMYIDVINVIVTNATQGPKQRKPQVFITSSIILSETEMKVLSKSYNYTLTPRIDNN